MRKDAKIGFAIGGVLLVVLFVYATVVSKHKKPNATVSIVNTPVNTPSTDVPSTPPLLSGGSSSSGSSPAAALVDSAPAIHPDTTPPAPPVAPAAAVTPSAETGITPPAPTDGLAKRDDQKQEKMPGISPDRSLTAGGDAGEAPRAAKNRLKSHTAEMEVPAAAPSSGDRTYVVQPGQTLSKIASEVYGNARFWVAIERENKQINPNKLKVGEKINLPDITPLQPGVVEEAADVETPVNVVEHPTRSVTPPAAALDAHSYVVKSGDSLYKIARTVLGNGRKAEALYALNKDAIGPDKSKLKLGMVLKLPEGASATVASPAAGR